MLPSRRQGVAAILAGKVALVTGGGTGIGKAIAKALIKYGARVAIASRNPAHLESTKNELQGTPEPLLALRMDNRKKDEVQTVVTRVLEAWEQIDILVNNAGLSGLNPVEDPDDSPWYDILDTNLSGTYLVTKAVIQAMKRNSGGRIINISSVLGRFGVPGYSAYCAAKHGVIGFTRALALEVAHRGITVNAICPGWVDTEMARHGMRESAAHEGISVEEFKKRALNGVPIKRWIGADEVAELAAYLASDQAHGITGQAINICGGQTMA